MKKDGTVMVDTHTNPNYHIPMVEDFLDRKET
jgi:hypothetical protein